LPRPLFTEENFTEIGDDENFDRALSLNYINWSNIIREHTLILIF
jgi:hypothetical protein